MREREVIALLRSRLSKIGDDCAVLPWGNTNLVLTTDMLHQKTDFPDGTSVYTIGWRSVAVSLSDIAAMGAKPLAMLIALGAPAFDRKFISEFFRGATDCAELCGTEIVGGDMDHHRELTVVTTALGVANKPLLRKGARSGQLLCVTGALGRTALALKLFGQNQARRANQLFRFTPRIREGLALAKYATSMMDISDGLARSLHQLSEASHVGFRVDPEEIPLIRGAIASRLDEHQLLEMALFTGEEFELVFTLPSSRLTKAQNSCEFTVIGETTSGGLQYRWDSRWRSLADRGYEHGV